MQAACPAPRAKRDERRTLTNREPQKKTATQDEPVATFQDFSLSPTIQAALERAPLPGRGVEPLVEAGDDMCILFVDSLRFDLGQRLAERLKARGCRTSLGRRWAALPTVTATAKPAVTPVADEVAGETMGADFGAHLEKSGKPANAPNLRAAMEERGYQMLGADTFDAPLSHPARGWLEAGTIDSLGHTLGIPSAVPPTPRWALARQPPRYPSAPPSLPYCQE